MKAMVCTRYGPPEVLQLAEVTKPVPKDQDVLIKVHATAVTASDCIIRGFRLPWWHPMGFMMGVVVGFGKPRHPILGIILAGKVEAVGKTVTRFKAGDAVYGFTLGLGNQIRTGAYAEYICLPEASQIAIKPPSITDEEAAAIAYGAGLAIFFLKKGGIQQRRKVLIYGASGSIGTAAIQLCKTYGADVTAVCSGANLDLVQSLGADHSIDYTQADAADRLDTYDLVLDAVGKLKSSALKVRCQQAQTPGGQYLSVDNGRPITTLDDFALFAELIAAGRLKAVIDRGYPLEQMAEAHRYVDQGHKRGNVVITVATEH